MKLKLIAAAVLAAVTLPSFAAIQTNDNAELVLIVFDGTASYAKDLGVTINDVVALSSGAAGYSFSIDLAANGGAAWTQFVGTDGVLAADTQWTIVGTDLNPPNGPAPNELRMLSTLTPTTNFAIYNGDWSVSMQQTGNKFIEINQTGNHTSNQYAINGESYNLFGTNAYFPPADALFSTNFATANNVGVSSGLVLTTRSNDFEEFDPISGTRLGNSQGFGVASFNGTTLAYTVAAVPEPGSVAMLLAGLGALGFVGKRRRRQG